MKRLLTTAITFLALLTLAQPAQASVANCTTSWYTYGSTNGGNQSPVKTFTPGTACWKNSDGANTFGLRFTPEGTLNIYRNGVRIWSANVHIRPASEFVLYADGNLALFGSYGGLIWNANVHQGSGDSYLMGLSPGTAGRLPFGHLVADGYRANGTGWADLYVSGASN